MDTSGYGCATAKPRAGPMRRICGEALQYCSIVHHRNPLPVEARCSRLAMQNDASQYDAIACHPTCASTRRVPSGNTARAGDAMLEPLRVLHLIVSITGSAVLHYVTLGPKHSDRFWVGRDDGRECFGLTDVRGCRRGYGASGLGWEVPRFRGSAVPHRRRRCIMRL